MACDIYILLLFEYVHDMFLYIGVIVAKQWLSK
jgi:hypothetical protein